ncbi:MAG: acyltransferase family protein [Oscillospiraceae bacterium]|nr:acyltransferase family protein [Oscillospiraceae bacterium]
MERYLKMLTESLRGYNHNLNSPYGESNSTISHRLVWLDVLKGIGIILVVLGHVYKNAVFYNFVYAFHMPLFFFAAGWLYKEKPILSYIKHRFYTVMVPYFSFGAVTLIYWQLIEQRFRSSDMSFLQAVVGILRGEFATLDFNVHLWFLPCFFLTVVIYNILRNLVGKKRTYVIVVFLSVVYLIDAYTQVGLPSLLWGLDCVFKYIAFYALGNWMSEKEVEARVESGNKTRLVAIATALLVIVFVLALFNLTGGILWFVTGTIGTMAVALYSILISGGVLS